MASPNPPTLQAPAPERQGISRRLPEVSARERDFWRRAVAEERERLDLAEHGAAAPCRPDAH